MLPPTKCWHIIKTLNKPELLGKTMKIIKELKSQHDWAHILNNPCVLYVEDQKVKINKWSSLGGFSIKMLLLGNAMKRGKECVYYVIDVNDIKVFEVLMAALDWSLEQLIQVLSKIHFHGSIFEHAGLKVRKGSDCSVRVFSPFSLTELKPLKKEPHKWTIAHAMRLLINGQFEELRCDSYYTDDYADDADRNYRKGRISMPIAWAKEIIERPDGWRVYKKNDSNRLHICCHSFNNNSLKIDLNRNCTNAFQTKEHGILAQ